MTPERKQYLDGIDKEEQTIREQLCMRKNRIKLLKLHMNECKNSHSIIDERGTIAKDKIIIKALMKQIPVPTRSNSCVVCGCKKLKGHIRFYSYGYCPECGQKLR